MHTMDKIKKNITIIGLALEIISIPAMIISLWFLTNFENIPGMSQFLNEMTRDEYEFVMWIFNLTINFLTIILMIIGFFTLVNIYLFSKLIKGKFTEEQAKKVYLYQAIWGGINLLFNQIAGILYLVSGVGGYNGHKEEVDIRHGI